MRRLVPLVVLLLVPAASAQTLPDDLVGDTVDQTVRKVNSAIADGPATFMGGPPQVDPPLEPVAPTGPERNPSQGDHTAATPRSVDPPSDPRSRDLDPRPDAPVRTETAGDDPRAPLPQPPQASIAVVAGAGLAALVIWLLRRRMPEDRTRRRILRLVRRDPGRHLSDLAREVGLDRTTVRHHVDRLVRDDLVTTRRTGRCRRIYPAEADDHDLADLLDHPVRAWIVRRLLHRRRLDQRRIREERDVAPSTLTYHAKRLEEAGIVERRSRGRRTVLELVEGWRTRLRDLGLEAARRTTQRL